MEQIDSNDFDSFLLLMEQEFGSDGSRREKPMQEIDTGLGFRVDIPQDFQKATLEEATAIFWEKERPPILFLAPDKRAGIAFQRLEKNIEKEQWMEIVRQAIYQADNRTVFYENGMIGKEDGIPWMEFKNFVSGGRVYHLVFLFRTEGRTFMGTFYCVFEDYTEWKTAAFRMLQSMGKRQRKE
ncbi:MAG TPA: hypothetical protein DCZ40_04700 [Lachnospiraceae bacterium]|nr:hypothetical protein [Lachnospiraceae bacterium]